MRFRFLNPCSRVCQFWYALELFLGTGNNISEAVPPRSERLEMVRMIPFDEPTYLKSPPLPSPKKYLPPSASKASKMIVVIII
jgi:hypothetical protein